MCIEGMEKSRWVELKGVVGWLRKQANFFILMRGSEMEKSLSGKRIEWGGGAHEHSVNPQPV